jgi:hypothetical protein
MSIPSAVVGAGNNSSAVNPFNVTFSQALSAIPTLESWDDSTFLTVTKEQFVGTAGNGNIPYVSAVATTGGAPASNWKPASPAAGGATINRLKGTTNFVNLSSSIPGSGGTVKWNLDFEVPSDAAVPSTSTFGVLAVRFSYSGAAPTLTFQFNDLSAGGTDGAPVNTNITPGSAGNFIRPADAGATSANVVMTKPSSGVLSAATIWVTNT